MKENVDNKDGGRKKELSRREFLQMVGGAGVGSLIARSEAGEILSAQEGPFNLEIQKKILAEVAREMKITLDPKMLLPVVIVAEQVSDNEFSRLMGFDVGDKRMNRFMPPNTIFLISKSRIHNLAHEITHYMQYNYRYLDMADDQAEEEAVYIQNKFRDFEKRPGK